MSAHVSPQIRRLAEAHARVVAGVVGQLVRKTLALPYADSGDIFYSLSAVIAGVVLSTGSQLQDADVVDAICADARTLLAEQRARIRSGLQ